ncbi:PREDICTED: head-specific guanylate cyclase [Dufourea novaeangliae]|uniref:guanylate cyclase n=1 Tax=Dufourea novaeangliae TaxID=178035 RepID=A0A154PR62_DUFNO|nr:PREDICTED: head-specific guanylate cyclase [Dufourea novaeangliae]KZC14382.1 Head-specific guanylate cyclase [Dufourea novaeangliae]
MACPFSRERFKARSDEGNGSDNNRRRTTGNAGPEDVGKSRQSSFEVSSLLTREEIEDAEDTQTLNLKHLRAAVLVLTNPSNEAVAVALGALLSKGAEPHSTTGSLEKLLYNVDTEENYNLLEDIYETLNYHCEIDMSKFFDHLGQELIYTACVGLLERAFRCLGNDLTAFLTTLDGVNDVVQHQSGSEAEAEFVCIATPEAIELHFTTDHPSVAYLLVGSLKGIARQFYNDNANVYILPDPYNTKFFRYRITPERYSEHLVVHSEIDNNLDTVTSPFRPLSTEATDLHLGVAGFCKAFPWHFVVDRQLELVQLGVGFMRIFGHHLNRLGREISTYFVFTRPRGVTLTFHEILKRANTPFVLTVQRPHGVDKYPAEGLEMKGQMVHCPESDSILFVSSPFLNGLEGLTGRGLFISDIPLHDATRDVILVGEQARAQDGLRRRMDKLKSSIEEANLAVSAEREKNVSLLHLIFPPDIAKRLWLGETIEAKTYPEVTMLFSDIVGFTEICSTATPMMVINMLQNLYEQFDSFCGQLDVYKVETIGDAYCVACGLHRDTYTHAQQIAWMALKMIQACSNHLTHKGKPIRMRIGIHTGMVLAGVVGKKMPRYCLFGHNVTLANKFESLSEPLRIHVSPTTYDSLLKCPISGFDLEPRSKEFLPKEFPANVDGRSYFLNDYKHKDVDANLLLDIHIQNAIRECGLGTSM